MVNLVCSVPRIKSSVLIANGEAFGEGTATWHQRSLVLSFKIV